MRERRLLLADYMSHNPRASGAHSKNQVLQCVQHPEFPNNSHTCHRLENNSQGYQFKIVNAVINTADKQETEEEEIFPPTNPDFQSKLK